MKPTFETEERLYTLTWMASLTQEVGEATVKVRVTAKDECVVLKYGLDKVASPNEFTGDREVEYILGSEGFEIGVPVLF